MSRQAWLVAFAAAMVTAAPTAADTLRDPTRPHTMQEVTTPRDPAVRVSAIFVSDSRRVAILNGRTVAEGDRVAGATVTRIDDNVVTLEFGGRTVTARLGSVKVRH